MKFTNVAATLALLSIGAGAGAGASGADKATPDATLNLPTGANHPPDILKNSLEEIVAASQLTLKLATELSETLSSSVKSAPIVSTPRTSVCFKKEEDIWNGAIYEHPLGKIPGHRIGIYRSTSESGHNQCLSSLEPLRANPAPNTNGLLIQSIDYNLLDNQTMCIFTENPFIEKDVIKNLERFAKEMVANENVDRNAIFEKYKNVMGLPNYDFNYNIHVWRTDSACSFFNLGYPKFIFESDEHEHAAWDQTKTEVATDTINSKTYTVQLSHSVANVKVDFKTVSLPINIMFLKRYEKGEANRLLVGPVEPSRSLKDMERLYGTPFVFSFLTREVSGYLCGAFFRGKDELRRHPNDEELSHLGHLALEMEQASKQGIFFLRNLSQFYAYTFKFLERINFHGDRIIYVTWTSKQECRMLDNSNK